MARRYNPRAEPTLDGYADGRPAYVPRMELVELANEGPKAWRRVWWLGGTVTTVERSDGIIVRSKDEWGTTVELERAIAWWLGKGYRAASPGGFMLQAARDWYRPVAWTRHGFARAGLAGGWEEAKVRGHIAGPHKVYDMRRAYRWALTHLPLPDRQTIRVAKRWTPKTPGLHLANIEPMPGAPWPLRDGGVQLIETPLDVRLYGQPKIIEWLGGVSWHRWINAQPLADLLDEVGVAALHRCYWGIWVASTPTRCNFRSGAVTWLKPYGSDTVRAHLILQRVRRRLAAVNASYRYVDAVIVPANTAIKTGTDVGDWREVKHYQDGLWIGWPGAYGPSRENPDKRSGMSARTVGQEKTAASGKG